MCVCCRKTNHDIETWSGERSGELVSKPTLRLDSGHASRNPKPETRNRLSDWNLARKSETRNPKPICKLDSGSKIRKPKAETDSETGLDPCKSISEKGCLNFHRRHHRSPHGHLYPLVGIHSCSDTPNVGLLATPTVKQLPENFDGSNPSMHPAQPLMYRRHKWQRCASPEPSAKEKLRRVDWHNFALRIFWMIYKPVN